MTHLVFQAPAHEADLHVGLDSDKQNSIEYWTRRAMAKPAQR
jgi:hypothetical protein